MSFSYHEYTKMYECDAVETVITYPARVSIQMIILYWNDAGDRITITDGISGHPDESADDVICDLYAVANYATTIINWSAKPRHFHGLKISAITANDCKAFIYIV